ncbi:MAG: SpoIIE family protein phosphatase [Crocinitomicaceae bacterium]|nr:SpoIIE family protein phosphatase [Crocinitomicaceae bacterium]
MTRTFEPHLPDFKRIAIFIAILFPFLSFAEIPDSCQSNFSKYIDVLENEHLTNQQVADSSRKLRIWDWKQMEDESFNLVVRAIENRIKESPTLEEKAPLHELLRENYQSRNNIGKAVVQYEKLIAIYSVLEDTVSVIHYYHWLSWMYHDNGLYEECMITYRNIIDIWHAKAVDFNSAHHVWTYGYLFSVAGWELKKPDYQDSAVKYISAAYTFAKEEQGDVHVEWTITYAMALARQGDKRKAIEVGLVGLKRAEELGDLLYIARFNKQLSQYYQSIEMKDSAYYYINRSAEYEFKMYPDGHPHQIKIGEGKSLHMYNLFFLISIHDHFGETAKSSTLLDRVLEGPEQIPDYNTLMEYRGIGAASYYQNGQFEKAANNYRLYLTYVDSVNKATFDHSKEVKAAQLESQIALEKERAQVEKTQQEELAQKEKENLRTIIYSTVSVAGVVIIFLVFLYRRFQLTSRQKVLIEKQKTMVESAYDQLGKKNKEVLDSISYATRIQNAILPSKNRIQRFLPNSFILYLPKDIVAGDFYWLEEKNGTILFAAADCTGHGVPGAMVSVVCTNGLNRVVREQGIVKPSDILEKTREIVIREFEKSEEEVNDGMDISLCAVNGNELQYAGAHNPLWIIRKGSNEIEEFIADKQPIGKFHYATNYTNHITTINPGDTVYVFTDGFADQFGGERGKKYYVANFQKLLLSIKDLSLDEQKHKIYEEFNRWKGDREQIDDICVMGVRF